MEMLRAGLTYANVMATIAVFVALGGSSYAALRVTSRNVPKDALTGADIKNLTGKDVRNNSLTGADVKNLTSGDVANGRLLAEDFAAGQLPRGETGATGATGQPGPTASTAADDGGNFPLDGVTTVIDLTDANDDPGDQQITTTFTGRILAVANAFLFSASSGDNDSECFLEISDGTGPGNGFAEIGTRVRTFMTGTSGVAPGPTTVIGSAVKPSGTYNVRLRCFELSAASFAIESSSLIVWAAAQ